MGWRKQPGHGQSVPPVSSILPDLAAAQMKERYILTPQHLMQFILNAPQSNLSLCLLDILVLQQLIATSSN